ncbi:MAG: hypothetical protein ACLFTT_11650 [Candidatus Hydrogenedentota bacterium]
MIAKDDLRLLMHHQAPKESGVLSVYLNVDQGQAKNLNREFELPWRNGLRALERRVGNGPQHTALAANAGRVGAFLRDYQPQQKTLVVFADVDQDFFWHTHLPISIASTVQWGPLPYLRPLLEASDEYARYGVALADRKRGRIFDVYLNHIACVAECEAELPVQRSDTSGKDDHASQMNFQRSADEHAKKHLKNVVEHLRRCDKERSFGRIILAGPTAALAELQRLLPHPLQNKLIATTALSLDAPENRVLEESQRIEAEHERASETVLVEDLITTSAKSGKATTGLEPTLRAAAEGRVRKLLYSDGLEVHGATCDREMLTGPEVDYASLLGGAIREDEDVIERIAVKTARDGGSIELLRGDAATRLQEEAGGIGAFLRY